MGADPQASGRWLLVLGAGPAQLGLLEAARTLGVHTAVCDRDPAAPGFALAGRRCLVSTDDEPGLERLAAALPLAGLIAPGTDPPVAVAARIAEKLRLSHPLSSATALLATSKVRQREALDAARIPQPRWQLVRSVRDVELPLPLVVKAADRTNRAGLAFVRRPSRLAAAVDAARAASRGGVVLAEEVVEGPEVTVVGFSAGGEYVPLAVWERLNAEVPAFGVPVALVWPTAHAEAAAEVTRRALEALGVAEGPSATLLRVSRGGPEVIEVAARLPGGAEAELAGLVSAVDLNGLALDAALGRPLAASELAGARRPVLGGAAVRYLLAPPGRLASVEVPQSLKGVVSARLYRSPGHVFGAFRRAADRAGAVLAAGATPAEALARAEAAAEHIRFLTAAAPAVQGDGSRPAAALDDARTAPS